MTTDGRTSAVLDPEERADRLLADLGTRPAGSAPGRPSGAWRSTAPTRSAGPGPAVAADRPPVHPSARAAAVGGGRARDRRGVLAVAIAIVAVIVLNAGFAFVQELQAERATEALREFLSRVRACAATAGRRGRGDGARARRRGAPRRGRPALGRRPAHRRRGRGRHVAAHRRVAAGAAHGGARRGPAAARSRPRISSSPARCAPAARPRRRRLRDRHGARSSAGSPRSRSACETEISPLQRQVNRAAQLIAVVAVLGGVLFFALGHAGRRPVARRRADLRDRPAGRQRPRGPAADDHARARRRACGGWRAAGRWSSA